MSNEARLGLIKIVSTGGTIANTPSGRLPVGKILDAIPQLSQVAHVQIEEIFRVGSSDITPDRWLIIAKRINEMFADDKGLRGIVVTHGSNTLEETAFFLHLAVKTTKPVVLTAAQRQFTTLSSDSQRNLLDAVCVASCPEAAGKGALVVVNTEIHSARDVTKRMSYRLQTYTSPDVGLLGFIDEQRVTFYRLPVRKHTSSSEFDVTPLDRLPTVDVLYTTSGADGWLIDAAVDRGTTDGIVVAVAPTGSPSPGMRNSLRNAADKGVPIVYANRGGQDRLRLLQPGEPFIAGDNLNAQKARILLMLALTKTKDFSEIQRIFNEY